MTMADKIIAPSLFHAEVGNTLWKNCRAGLVALEDAQNLYKKATQLVDKFIDTKSLTPAALRRACRLKHSVYDMYYLAAADRYDAHVMSLDKRLVKLAEEEGLHFMEFTTIPWDYPNVPL